MNEDTYANSVLETIKSLLGIESTYTGYDQDIIVHINSGIFKLCQIGVSPEPPVLIYDNSQTWGDVLISNEYFEAAKTYIYLCVKIIFDPPTSSMVMEALKETMKEYEWRLMEMASYINADVEEDSGSHIDYNTLINKPTLNDVELVGDVKMDIASKQYVSDTIEGIEDVYY